MKSFALLALTLALASAQRPRYDDGYVNDDYYYPQQQVAPARRQTTLQENNAARSQHFQAFQQIADALANRQAQEVDQGFGDQFATEEVDAGQIWFDAEPYVHVEIPAEKYVHIEGPSGGRRGNKRPANSQRFAPQPQQAARIAQPQQPRRIAKPQPQNTLDSFNFDNFNQQPARPNYINNPQPSYPQPQPQQPTGFLKGRDNGQCYNWNGDGVPCRHPNRPQAQNQRYY